MHPSDAALITPKLYDQVRDILGGSTTIPEYQVALALGDDILDEERYRAYLKPVGEEPEKGWPYEVSSFSSTYRAEGYTPSDAIEKLVKLVEQKYLAHLLKKVEKVLPYAVCRTLDAFAQTWLETRHTVIIGRGDPEKVAHSVLQRNYYQGLRDTAEEILQGFRDGDLDEDGVSDRIGEHEVIYTHEALTTLLISSNHATAWDEGLMEGEEPKWEAAASYAQQADLREMIDGPIEAIKEAKEEAEKEDEEENDAEEEETDGDDDLPPT